MKPVSHKRFVSVKTMTDTKSVFPSSAPLIEFENVSVVKGEKRVLDRIALSIGERENIAILGPNGAGKSSLVKAIMREYYPITTEGPVTFKVRGEEVWDVFSLRSCIGIVSNDLQYTFTRNITGREVVVSGFFSSVGLFNHTVTPEMEKKTDEILSFLEVTHLADRSMKEMSSGEARRLLIGRALVHNPATLILDEPTNSLDLHALHTFRQVVRKIAQAGTGIILVTHNLYDIVPEISRVIMVSDGKISGDGPKSAMLTDEKIGALFSVPIHVHEENGWYYATGF
jgi:iron complex transport system ATP-binding protein